MDGTKVVVGVDGSLASLHALRHAVAEARYRNAELAVVHVIGFEERVVLTARELERAAQQYADRFFAEAMGGPPGDVHVRAYLRVGETVAVLCGMAADGDLLVVGAARRRRPWRFSPTVTRGCLARATCPLLVVPAPRLAREVPGGRRRRWRGLDELLAAGSGTDPGRRTRR